MPGGGRRRRAVSRRPKRKRGFGRLRMAFYGATGGHFAGVTMVSAAKTGLPRFFARIEAFEINAPMAQTLAGLNAFKPDFVSGYTTALKMLGEKQRDGLLHISPIAIAATGETVTKADMDFLSKAFDGAQVVSAYGCTEHLGLGASDPGGETMTLFDNDLIFEFREDHSLITNLFNYTMPLIRYRMSDILRPVSGPDDRDLVIEALVGRTERTPTFVNKDGLSDFISPHTINEIFVAGVTRFQFQITGEASFRFPICLDPGLDAEGRAAAVAGVEARLAEILRQKAMDNVRFEVPVVADIPVNARTRKFQLIVDTRAAT
jgi:phenylacetate-CoA ligase